MYSLLLLFLLNLLGRNENFTFVHFGRVIYLFISEILLAFFPLQLCVCLLLCLCFWNVASLSKLLRSTQC